jgi:NAD(P)-dependent dehydrogenase (short-subunit alcohol dehydrogenase family)
MGHLIIPAPLPANRSAVTESWLIETLFAHPTFNEDKIRLKAMERQADAYQASIDDLGAEQAMVQLVISDFGGIDILVNNAGIGIRGNTMADTDPAKFERVVRTHRFGTFYCCHEVIPYIRKLPRGDIIMAPSAATRRWAVKGDSYYAGKAGTEAFANGIAKEELRNKSRVNIVAPGIVETDKGKPLVQTTRGVDEIRDRDATSPFGKVCQPADVANVERYLASELNTYVTGERIYVDGLASIMN